MKRTSSFQPRTHDAQASATLTSEELGATSGGVYPLVGVLATGALVGAAVAAGAFFLNPHPLPARNGR